MKSGKKRIAFFLIIAVIVILLVLGIVNILGKRVSISIDSGEIGYVICYSGGFGPRRLDYQENKAFLDGFFDMLSGEYTFVRIWNNRGVDGGGPSSIYLYGKDGSLIDTILYVGGLNICTPAWIDSVYYVYHREGEAAAFYNLDEYLAMYGEYE